MSLLPIRSRTLHFFSTVDKANVDDVMEGLKAEYGKERQFTRTNFITHLLNLRANDLIDEDYSDIDSEGRLVVYYKLNDVGRNCINKYMPKKWRTN